MNIEFAAADSHADRTTAIAQYVLEGAPLTAGAAALDAATGGAITRAMEGGSFRGAPGQTLILLAPHGVEAASIALVGAGKPGEITDQTVERAGAEAYLATRTSGARTLLVRAPGPGAAARAAFGVRLAAYRFDRYRTTEKPEKKPTLDRLVVSVDDPAAAKSSFEELAGLADAVIFARDLVSEPANILYPEEFARRAKALESIGLQVEVLGEKEMTRLGMGALLGVGQGSVRESQLVVMRWNGASDPDAAPIAFIGKGVTFDTGGISLKQAEGMEEMITDMGGAAAVCGAMYALAKRGAKANVVGIMPLVENMPDGAAQR
ncbi:MAG: leucyl aminopeptidase, partial [Caulobacteraceae bacterium]|nr:leucyl aminopeptidase [Caulobacteraceae bacterium]